MHSALRIFSFLFALVFLQLAFAAPRPSATIAAASALESGSACSTNVLCCESLQSAKNSKILLEMFGINGANPNEDIGLSCTAKNAKNPTWCASIFL